MYRFESSYNASHWPSQMNPKHRRYVMSTPEKSRDRKQKANRARSSIPVRPQPASSRELEPCLRGRRRRTTSRVWTLCRKSTTMSFSCTPSPLKCLRVALASCALLWRRISLWRRDVGECRPTLPGWDKIQRENSLEKAPGESILYARWYACRTPRSNSDHCNYHCQTKERSRTRRRNSVWLRGGAYCRVGIGWDGCGGSSSSDSSSGRSRGIGRGGSSARLAIGRSMLAFMGAVARGTRTVWAVLVFVGVGL